MTKTPPAASDTTTATDDGFLTREAVLSASDTRYEVVDVPEWGGRLRMRSMTGKARDRIEAMVTKVKGRGTAVAENIRASVVAECAVSGAGAALFTPADIAALGEKNAAALDRAFECAWKLSGMGAEAAKAIEDELKNDHDAAG